MNSNSNYPKTGALVLAAAAAVIALFVACRSAPTHDTATRAARAPGPTIVRLVGRDTTITISAGDHQTLYSAVKNHGGTVLATNLTLDELCDCKPYVYRQIQPA